MSAGGTRRVRRRRRKADGTYGTDEEYHSDESIAMRRAIKKKKKKQRHGSDSEYRFVYELYLGIILSCMYSHCRYLISMSICLLVQLLQ